jgi:glyoxylase-like metal-dependent hydrolase (beta-lactamase superfamily II)
MPDQLRVRMYRVGFGESFLLTVTRAGESVHVLIDCGVHGIDIGSLDAVVADIAATSGGRLALVIATHRHADHIAGFARCADRFAQLEVGEVWMSWWDDPDNATAAAVQAQLASGGQELEARLAARGADAPALLAMAENVSGEPISIGGGRARANEVALDVLRSRRFKNRPPVRYVKAGDRVTLPAPLVVAGVSAELIGPVVSPAAMTAIARAGAAYAALTAVDVDGGAGPPFEDRWRVDAPFNDDDVWPMTEAQLRETLAGIAPDGPGMRAAAADNAINEQSVAVAFTIEGRRLLFIGDALRRTWNALLYGDGGGELDRPVRPDAEQLLRAIQVFKVPQHGRSYVVPPAAIALMPDQTILMCSTEPGRYGDHEIGSPRAHPVRGVLARSDQVPAGAAAATAGLPPVTSPFTTPGQLYIDYTFDLASK